VVAGGWKKKKRKRKKGKETRKGKRPFKLFLI
jgi:hypothetical protein